METVRLHGMSPYRIVVVHGGPGAIGSLGLMAENLSEFCGVVEPFQSKYSIAEQIEELHTQMLETTQSSVVLLGHSWGAWLAVLYAVRYPEAVTSLVLVGTPPLKNQYALDIQKRRMSRLSDSDATRMRAMFVPNSTIPMDEVERLVYKCDNDNPFPIETVDCFEKRNDAKMNHLIWKEASKMRIKGELLRSFLRVKCPVLILHGMCDPHPASGIIEPLRINKFEFSIRLFPRCGHSPFYEQEWASEFYEIVRSWVFGEK